MIEIDLKSPKVYAVDDSSMLVILSHQMFFDNLHNIKIPVKYTILIECKEKLPDGRFRLPISSEVVSPKTASFLYEVKKKIGSCVQLAESLFESLKAINLRLINRQVNNDVFAKYSDKYAKLDFMGHRNLFSDIIQSKKDDVVASSLQEYNSKNLTKSMHGFITDRNKYTHGDLMYFQNKRTTILKYLNKDIEEYGFISEDVINSFVSCYEVLNEFLGKLLKALNDDEFQRLFPNK